IGVRIGESDGRNGDPTKLGGRCEAIPELADRYQLLPVQDDRALLAPPQRHRTQCAGKRAHRLWIIRTCARHDERHKTLPRLRIEVSQRLVLAGLAFQNWNVGPWLLGQFVDSHLSSSHCRARMRYA